MNRNLWYLVAAQTLFLIGNMMFLALAPILGKQLSSNASFATLPLGVSILTMLVCSFPVSLWMGRRGRRPAFVVGLLANAGASLVFFYAIQIHSFPVLLLGCVVLGVAMASANFYRFAAMELVAASAQSKAISAVMAVGVVAALVGPNLAAITKNLYFPLDFSSSVLTLLPLSLLGLISIVLIRWPLPPQTENKRQSVQVASENEFDWTLCKPVFAAMVAYGVMVLVMSATPLHMDHHGYDFTDTAWVIQWHVLGMFAPSFFVGWLVQRISLNGVMILGALVLLVALLVNLIANNRPLLTLGLLLLGIGWNFLFLGASQWLVQLSVGKSAARIQGANEVCVFGLAALASFSSGWLINILGWSVLNLLALPLLLGLLLLLSIDGWRARRLQAEMA